MENNGPSSSSSPSSIANHGSSSSQPSPWLQQTLSDLNKKMVAMINLLDEDESSSARTEFYQAKRLELRHMLDEFSDSYRSLAEKHDHLSSKFLHVTTVGQISSSYSPRKLEPFDSCQKSIMEDHDVGCGNTKDDLEYLNKLIEELMSTEQCNVNMKHDTRENQCKDKTTVMYDKKEINMTTDDCNLPQDQDTVGDLTEGSFEVDSWSELKIQVSKLMQENLQQQAELARRNIEKRVMINRLQLQLKHLKHENRAIQGYISCSTVGEKHSQLQISKLKRVLSSKFFGLGCS